MSYLERTLWWFFKNRIFGGIKKLKEKNYFPFAILVVGLACINTTLAILFQMGLWVSLKFIQDMLIFQLFISIGIIISGFTIGKIKSLPLYYLMAAVIIFLSVVVSLYFNLSYNHSFIQYSKLIFFVLWVFIACLSFFFLTLYFFTSFPKKVIMLGAPKDHVFFGPVIKAVIFISIPLYVYIIFQLSPASIIVGGFGIIIALSLYIFIKRAPKKANTVPGIINFTGALGFFYLFLFYHLAVSFSLTSDNISSIMIDIFLLLIITLYIIQSLTRRISDSPQRTKTFENPVRFQMRLFVTDRLKNRFGEHGVVLIIIGIVLGYQMAFLDALFITPFPLLSSFFTSGLKLSAIYHRIYLMFGFVVILTAMITFSNSKEFKQLMVDKYTFKQALKFLGFYFQKSDMMGGISPVGLGIKELGAKLGNTIVGLGKTWKETLTKKVDKGKEEGLEYKKDQNDDNE